MAFHPYASGCGSSNLMGARTLYCTLGKHSDRSFGLEMLLRRKVLYNDGVGVAAAIDCYWDLQERFRSRLVWWD